MRSLRAVAILTGPPEKVGQIDEAMSWAPGASETFQKLQMLRQSACRTLKLNAALNYYSVSLTSDTTSGGVHEYWQTQLAQMADAEAKGNVTFFEDLIRVLSRKEMTPAGRLATMASSIHPDSSGALVSNSHVLITPTERAQAHAAVRSMINRLFTSGKLTPEEMEDMEAVAASMRKTNDLVHEMSLQARVLEVYRIYYPRRS